MMTPGDVSMLLNETNGLRVQTTSPSLGGANVRIQGLRGRYTQMLADGLPLYGGQTGSIGLLQIPPMDLGQVEVIKGVASALYGMSAIGGVVNLVSRRPPETGREGEVLVNRTSHAGTDVVNWLAAPLNERWGYTFSGGAHFQERSDLDDDGWTDLPMYRRVVARPRIFWDNGSGRSALVALGGMAEERRGGTMPGARRSRWPAVCGEPRHEAIRRRRSSPEWPSRADAWSTVRGSATTQTHTHTFGEVVEADDHRHALRRGVADRRARAARLGDGRRVSARELHVAGRASLRLHALGAWPLRAGRVHGLARAHARRQRTRRCPLRVRHVRESACLGAGAAAIRRGRFASAWAAATSPRRRLRKRPRRPGSCPSLRSATSTRSEPTTSPPTSPGDARRSRSRHDLLLAHSRCADVRETGLRGVSDRGRQRRRPDAYARHRIHRALSRGGHRT